MLWAALWLKQLTCQAYSSEPQYTQRTSSQALRAQCDRDLYKQSIQSIINNSNIEVMEGEVTDLIVEKDNVMG